MAAPEAFRKDGPWITSSVGFTVRSLGRTGMEYVRGSVRLTLDSESLATRAFVLDRSSLPEADRDQILDDLSRAWAWAGFDVETV